MSTASKHLPGQRSAIQYLDGQRLRRAVIAGVKAVCAAREHLNKINVFPVADGDTGTNLALSMNAVMQVLSRHQHDHAGATLELIADTALDNARGNSGAILAQFFLGTSEVVCEEAVLNTTQMAEAVFQGQQSARNALSKPREGTILSVMRDFADSLLASSRNGVTDFVELMNEGLAQARKSLANTPKQLEVLRKAGVVDAGAEGFVDFIAGMVDYINNGDVRLSAVGNELDVEFEQEEMAGEVSDLDFKYCTECLVKGTDIDRRKLKERLSAIGGSLVLAGTRLKTKIHIHVNDPDDVFELAAQYGEVSGQKADDMHQQQELTHHQTQQVAITTDSAADVPDQILEDLGVHMVPVRLHFGDESYIDRISLSPKEYFQKLREHPVHPQTSQPSPGEFRRNFDFLASHYKEVISINVTASNSGTYQSAALAAKRSKHNSISVVDSKSASVGQALLVMRAAEYARQNKGAEYILKRIPKLQSEMIVAGVFPDLSSAVRGGRVKPVVKKIADVLKLVPIFGFNPRGKIAPRSVFFGRRNLIERLANFLAKKTRPGQHYQLAIACGENQEDGTLLIEHLREACERRDVKLSDPFCTTVGTALSVHTGPYCVLAALLPLDDSIPG